MRWIGLALPALAAGCASALPSPAAGLPREEALLLPAALPLAAPGEEPPAPAGPGAPADSSGKVFTTLQAEWWSVQPSGHLSFFGQDGPLGEGPGEASKSDAAWGGRIEAYRHRVSFLLEGFWTSVQDEDASGASGELDYLALDLASTMRFLGPEPWERGAGEVGALAPILEGMAGFRWHFAEGEVGKTGFPDTHQDVAWIDLFVGGRASAVLLGRLTAFARADVGGMAAWWYDSWSSKAEVGLHLALGRSAGIAAGWRWYQAFFDDVDDDAYYGAYADEFDLDLRLTGPWVGLTVQF